ncbi:NDRG3 [Branchiostoma lanceolatum]|uniref:NDRG3 protein n=1 Tax=Branchiostoma lanceolatum TaxID=7740 RepID=A0A8K0ERC1_BRALA|nr:NDRG3 [Branchiostoma lanceolatum]
MEETKEIVKTDKFGDVTVFVAGDRKLRVFLTVHDIGQNHKSFHRFLLHEDMKAILSKFCIVQITVPGQEDEAETLPNDYKFPTMQEMGTEVIPQVLASLGCKTKDVVGLGVGAGANILCRYAMFSAYDVLGLCLLECSAESAGFLEWGQEKITSLQLNMKGMNPTSESYLIWHHYGNAKHQKLKEVHAFHDNLYKTMNPHNLACFVETYMARTNFVDKLKTMKCRVLMVTGSRSAHVKDVERTYSAMDRQNSEILKLDGGDVMEDNPEKLAESMLFFLQGLGLVASVVSRKMSRGNSLSRDSQ